MPEYLPEPRTYELMTILSPDVPEDDIPSSTEEIGGYISSASGELQETLTDSPWGRRRLAYPIRHAGRDIRDGFYTVYHFLIQPSQVGEIERELKLNTSVMRYLLTRYEPVPPEELSEEEAEIVAEDEAAAAYAAAQAAGETSGGADAADVSEEPQAEAEGDGKAADATSEEAASVTASEDQQSETIATDEVPVPAEEPADSEVVAEVAEGESADDADAEVSSDTETEEG